MSFMIGVDLGGTKIALAAVDRQGNILASDTLPTLPENGAEDVVKRASAAIQKMTRALDLSPLGIGVGCPGPVDSEQGIVAHAANLGWRNFPLQESLQGHLHLPIRIENDVNAEALGELYFGVAQGVHDFIYLAIGTGLGGCAVVNGQILRGTSFSAMEVGHISLNPTGRLCGCGKRGCVETVVAGKGLMAAAQEYAFENSDTSAILEAARVGHPVASRIINEAADALGIVLGWCAIILNPSLCVIGGGLGHAAYDLLIPKAEQMVQERVFDEAYRYLKIGRSQVQISAIGAAALAWHYLF